MLSRVLLSIRISTSFCRTCRMLRSTAWPMQTGSGVVLRFDGRKRNATFKTTCGSSRALTDTTMAHTPGCSFLKQCSHSLGTHTEAFQATSEDDSDRDADASNHEPVVNSTPPATSPSPLSLHPMTCARCALSNLATG